MTVDKRERDQLMMWEGLTVDVGELTIDVGGLTVDVGEPTDDVGRTDC